ncbi:2-hydroxymuconate tautomerase [Paenibacillus chungangensis]|uniref:2-hydroxymuconate tautomerase n=1 Tax=Paenibacillus chungangensis TaxID=696535 RepID=A0ABW3HQZ2_9BACL
MPFIHVEVLEGLSTEKKQELVKEMTDMFVRIAGAPQERVFIFFEDLKRDNYARGGSLVSLLPPPSTAPAATGNEGK